MLQLEPRQPELAHRRNAFRRLYLFFFAFPPTQLDVAIDGADEVDADLALIKGGG